MRPTAAPLALLLLMLAAPVSSPARPPWPACAPPTAELPRRILSVADRHRTSEREHLRAQSLRIRTLVRGRCAEPLLLAALDDPSADVRARAALEMARLGLAVERVRRAASSAPDARPQPSAWTCGMHPHVVVAAHGHCPICGMELIERPSAPAVSPLGRVEALAALHHAGHSAAAERLVTLVLRDDSGPHAYVALLLLLRGPKSPQARQWRRVLRGSTQTDVQTIARAGLTRAGDAAARRSLREAARGGNQVALELLGEVGGGAESDLLTAVRRDASDPAVRRSAAVGLALLGSPSALTAELERAITAGQALPARLELLAVAARGRAAAMAPRWADLLDQPRADEAMLAAELIATALARADHAPL